MAGAILRGTWRRFSQLLKGAQGVPGSLDRDEEEAAVIRLDGGSLAADGRSR